jgi:hypothetical protein
MRRALFSSKAVRRVLLAATVLAATGAGAQSKATGISAPGLSLVPARTLDLSLHEATWMQPDVSPDGGTILFNVLGDLYAVDAKGGAARPGDEERLPLPSSDFGAGLAERRAPPVQWFQDEAPQRR